MLSPGVQLGNRYRLDERIASGGMGDVWRGTDQVLGRTVAVKSLLPALLDEPGFAERFRGEARTMATINHPGVVDVYDFGSDQQIAFLVMEYVEGDALSSHAEPGRPAHPGPDDGAGRAGRRRAARRAREGHRAPRREAGQPAGPAERHAGAHRLRHRPLRRWSASSPPPGRCSAPPRTSRPSRPPARSPPPPPTCTRSAWSPTSASPAGGRSRATTRSRSRCGTSGTRPGRCPADIPPQVRAIVERALAKDPAARWPSAAALAGGRPAGQGSRCPSRPAAAATPVRSPVDPDPSPVRRARSPVRRGPSPVLPARSPVCRPPQPPRWPARRCPPTLGSNRPGWPRSHTARRSPGRPARRPAGRPARRPWPGTRIELCKRL